MFRNLEEGPIGDRGGLGTLSPNLWRRYLAANAALVVAFFFLHDHPAAQAWIFLAVSVGELVAVLVGIRSNGLRRHRVWLLIGASLVLYVPANMVWYGAPVLLNRPLPFPSLADYLYLPGYVLLLTGLVTLIRKARSRDRSDLLDAGMVAIAGGMAFWMLAIEPAITESGLTLLGRAFTVSYPLVDLALVAIVARMIVGGVRRPVAFWLVCVSILIELASDLGYSTTALKGTFHYGGWVVVGFLLQYAFMGAAALHPSAFRVTESRNGNERRHTSRVLTGFSAALGPVLLLVPGVRTDPDLFFMVVVGWTAMMALGVLRLRLLMVDVETYRGSQNSLRVAELRYRTLVEHVPGVVYMAEYGEAGNWSYVSPKIEELLGYTLEEWLAHPAPWSTHVHPDDLQRAFEDEERARRLGEPLSSEYRMFSRDGRLLWIRDEAALVPDEHGEPRYWQGVMTDISQVKETEQRLRSAAEERRSLLVRLVTAQEEERSRVANDIHDDPIQKMTAVGMRIAALKARVPAELRGSVEKLDQTVSLAIGRLRRLMFELRPLALDREGLEAALRQYMTEMAEECGCSFEIDNRLAFEASAASRAAAYRIAQEALVNVRKHSGAKKVRVTLDPRGDGLLVRIDDDGVGFTPDPVAVSPNGHMGLTTMRERAELAGGWCRVDSSRGHGTVVEFWLPADWIVPPKPTPVGAEASIRGERWRSGGSPPRG